MWFEKNCYVFQSSAFVAFRVIVHGINVSCSIPLITVYLRWFVDSRNFFGKAIGNIKNITRQEKRFFPKLKAYIAGGILALVQTGVNMFGVEAADCCDRTN